MDHFDQALQLLASGRLNEARIYLEELLRQDPDNPDLLYNLGLCYVDLGQLDLGIELLLRCLRIAPQHPHARVALGIAYLKLGDLPRAREYTMQALAADPRNPVALKNLGRDLRQGGGRPAGSLLPAPILPGRPQGHADRVRPRLRRLTGDMEPAQKHFQAVLEMEAPEVLRGLARDGLRKIAARELKARGAKAGCGLLFAGRHVAVSGEVAAEGPDFHLV
jgi:tetratricopeptide (TPR) repeat protein